MIHNKIIGQRIASCIRDSGFKSRAAFARRIGMPKETLRNICNGNRTASVSSVALIAKNLNTSMDFLVLGIDAVDHEVACLAQKIRRLPASHRLAISALLVALTDSSSNSNPTNNGRG